MPTERHDEIEYSEEGKSFTCPVARLGPFLGFLAAEGVRVFKVESGIYPRTGKEVRFVFLESGEAARGESLARKFTQAGNDPAR